MAQMPREGFIRIVAPKKPRLTPQEKAKLIRKANQLFNSGDLATAEKIFLTLGYTDGIIRVGDSYYNNANFLEAFRLYKLAPAPDKVAYMVERMAGIVREWMNE